MDQELLMKQIVEQVMAAMKTGTSAPSAPSIDASFPAEPDAAPPSAGGFISARSQYILDQQRKYGKTAVPDKSVSPFLSPPESPAANPSAGSAVSPRPPRFPAVLRTIR